MTAILALGVTACLSSCGPEPARSGYEWRELAELPPIPRGGGPVRIAADDKGIVSGVVEPEESDASGSAPDLALFAWGQPGLAGPMVGLSAGALIVGGGANFPEAMPWDGGAKHWDRQVYVLSSSEAKKWKTRKGWWLPKPIAYGVSISTAEGVICIGGCDAEQCYSESYRLTWDPAAETFSTAELAPMPVPLAFMAGAQIGGSIYVVGGQRTMQDASATTDFLAYDLASDSWAQLPAFPGPPRVLPLAVAQSDGEEVCLYVISGRDIRPGEATRLLSDAWKYSPSSRNWSEVAPVSADGGSSQRCVMAGTCLARGENEIVVFGGADGELLLELEQLGKVSAGEGAEAEAASAKSREILTNHPGFSRDILSYDTVADQWTKVGEMPQGSQVTTTALPWNDGVVIPTGEIQPGVRTPKVWFGSSPPRSR